MTPDVSADATQAARERLVFLINAAGFEYVGVPSASMLTHLRIILAALTAAEAQRDAALALAGEMTTVVSWLAILAARPDLDVQGANMSDPLSMWFTVGQFHRAADLEHRAAALVAKADEPT